MSTDLILSLAPEIELFAFLPAALQQRDRALELASLIGKVENAEQNSKAVLAHIELKRISLGFEKQRKQLKEPLLDAGRRLDRLVATELLEIEKEIGRISNLTSQFQLVEQRRVREEQELQRKELARIEAEKQAELARIAREQEEANRKAREAQEAAQRLIDEAKNQKQREEAMRAQAAAKIQAEETARKQAEMQSETQRIQEAAQAAAAAEAKPIAATRAFGQAVKTDWEITVLNPWELAKFHPDCVTITPLLLPIKQALNAGVTVKGIRAERITKTNVRVGTAGALIEV